MCLLCLMMKLIQLITSLGFQSMHIHSKLNKGPYVVILKTYGGWF
jgi:hypothetical protein